MTPDIDMATCQNLAVPWDVMRHIVQIESGANPYAIGVVGARLMRQPKKLDEAVATARMLEARGYNFSLGLAQINRSNLGKYGLDTHEKAFDVCANLAAGARILAGCRASAWGDWSKAFSCYYSGNFVTGFRHGYVQKVYDAIGRGMAPEPDRSAMRAAPLNASAGSAPVVPPARSQPGAPPVRPAAEGVFVPQVRGFGEPAAAPPAAPVIQTDPTDPHYDTPDSAFVF